MDQKVRVNLQTSMTNEIEFESKSKIFDLPKKYYDKTYSNFEDKTENLKVKKEKCYEFAKGETEKKSLVMTGSVGSGKTHLAVMIAKNLAKVQSSLGGFRESTVKFTVADELFTKFNDLVFEKKSKMDFIDELLRNDLLIIDDLGVANYTPAKQENFYLLINRAYLDQRRLLITTNFTLDELAKFDERIISRLVEMAIILKFDEKDYRIKK